MHISLQTSEYMSEESPDAFLDQRPDPLQMEHGWRTVASGLAKILIGHLIWIIGVGAALTGIIVGFMMFLEEGGDNADTAALKPSMIIFYGVIFLWLCSIISFFTILSGKWRCAINAPERGGAKWLVFACMLCILLGPTISILTGLTSDDGLSKQVQVDRDGVAHLELGSPATIMQIVGIVLGLAGTFFFVMFLRAVAGCFENFGLQKLTEIYLVAAAILIGLTLQLLIFVKEIRLASMLLLFVGLGWLLLGLWYLFLIFATRTTIMHGIANLRSPLEQS